MVAMSGTSLPKIRIGLAAGFSILKILKRNLPDGFFGDSSIVSILSHGHQF